MNKNPIYNRKVAAEMNANSKLALDRLIKSYAGNNSCVWEYSQYRATLRRNGVAFAIVTRDGKNSLNPKEQEILLAALNAALPEPAER